MSSPPYPVKVILQDSLRITNHDKPTDQCKSRIDLFDFYFDTREQGGEFAVRPGNKLKRY